MNIIISNLAETMSVTMPKTRQITAGGENESKTVTTTSGRIVDEMIGFRQNITAYWEWVPADVMADLCAMLRMGTMFKITYPDPAGMLTKVFRVKYPAPGIFRYKNGAPIWCNISLVMSASEVE